jgi:hypothetical protein
MHATARARRPRQTFLSAALETVVSVMKMHALKESNVRIGVMLMGTERTKNDNNFEHIYLLHPLAVTSPAVIKNLKDCASVPDKLIAEVGTPQAGQVLPLAHALWACSSLLRVARPVDKKTIWCEGGGGGGGGPPGGGGGRGGPPPPPPPPPPPHTHTHTRPYHRRVLTNDDSPAVSAHDCEVRAADAWAAGIEILVLPMLAPGRTAFDGRFWSRIVAAEDEETRQVAVAGGGVVEVALPPPGAAAAVEAGAAASSGGTVVPSGKCRYSM